MNARAMLRFLVVIASAAPAFGDVLCGIDVLQRDNFKPLHHRKIAIVTNHTGRDRDGRRTIDLLVAAPDVTVVRLFSPEHGIEGTADEKVSDTIDRATGLTVHSLYGETLRPTPAMLEGIDTIVYDIQNLSARFYTRQATLGYIMEAAAERGIRVVVLDRPNPTTGRRADGPIADEHHLGFTAYARLPVVHGMTIGELARLFNEKIRCNLDVIRMQNWRRSMWFDETGLPWINTSPNIRNLTQATLYPAIGLLEFTNISVGRGTDRPFETLGAPWIDARKLAAHLNAANLPGVRFVPIEFTPRSSKYAREKCAGVYILVTDRDALEPTRTALTIAWTLRKLFPNDYDITRLNTLLVNDQVFAAIKTTEDLTSLADLWREPLRDFDIARQRCLLYP